MDRIPYRDVFEAESGRLLAVLAEVDPTTAVPSCPEWTVADLLWHVGESHGFWAQVVGELLEDASDAVEAARPADGDLHAFVTAQRDALLDAFRGRGRTERCWSWSEHGGDVGWAQRRNAHEALVHRVDAELAAGVEVTRPGTGVAADGVDELVHEFLVGVPAWATWSPEGGTVAIDAAAPDTDADADADTDAGAGAGRRYVLALGRMVGTSPSSGRSHDLAAAELVQDTSAAVDVEVAGDAWRLDLWLWGRAGPEGLEVSGASDVLDRFRALVGDATQ